MKRFILFSYLKLKQKNPQMFTRPFQITCDPGYEIDPEGLGYTQLECLSNGRWGNGRGGRCTARQTATRVATGALVYRLADLVAWHRLRHLSAEPTGSVRHLLADVSDIADLQSGQDCLSAVRPANAHG